MSFATKVKLKFFIMGSWCNGSIQISKICGNCSSRLGPAKLNCSLKLLRFLYRDVSPHPDKV